MADSRSSTTTNTGTGAGNSSTNSNGNATGIMGRVKQSATNQLTSQKNRAADGVSSVTQALRQSTQQLRDQQHETIAQYVEQAANQVDRWCDQIRNKDVTEVLDDVQRLARRQPAVFIGGAFALGLLGARFLKSSNENEYRSSERYSGNTRGYAGNRSRAQFSGGRALSEAADAPSTTGGVSVSDVDAVISRPGPDTAAPAPGGGAASSTGSSTRTRRTQSDKSSTDRARS